jgi:hypothetical protein
VLFVSQDAAMNYYVNYLREQAAKYRQLAEKAKDSFIKLELLDLAVICEQVADNVEGRASLRF